MTIDLAVIDKEAIDSRAEVTNIDKDSLKHVETEDFSKTSLPTPQSKSVISSYSST